MHHSRPITLVICAVGVCTLLVQASGGIACELRIGSQVVALPLLHVDSTSEHLTNLFLISPNSGSVTTRNLHWLRVPHLVQCVSFFAWAP